MARRITHLLFIQSLARITHRQDLFILVLLSKSEEELQAAATSAASAVNTQVMTGEQKERE